MDDTLTRAGGRRVWSGAATRVTGEPGRAAFATALPLADLEPGDYLLSMAARAGRRTVRREVLITVS